MNTALGPKPLAFSKNRIANKPRLGPVVYNGMANTGFGRSRFLTPTGALHPITRKNKKTRVLGTPALKNARPLNGVSE